MKLEGILVTLGARYSRMDQVKFMEDSLKVIFEVILKYLK